MKKSIKLIGLAIISFLFLANYVSAEPKNGFGLFVSSAKTTASDINQIVAPETQSTLGAGVDYQIALGDSYSVALFSSEHAQNIDFVNSPDLGGIKYDIVGVAGNIWFGSFFIGLHYSQYFGIFIKKDLSSFSVNSAPGGGFDFGYEGDNGWFFSILNDSVSNVKTTEGQSFGVSGTRAVAGYRWR